MIKFQISLWNLNKKLWNLCKRYIIIRLFMKVKIENTGELVELESIKNKSNIVTDYFDDTKYYDINKYNNLYTIYSDIECLGVTNICSEPTNKDGTYRYMIIHHYTMDHNKINGLLTMSICLYRIGMVTIYVKSKEKIDEIVNRLQLTLGANNPNVYYAKRELNFMDRPQPYRKFNNIYYKQSFDSVYGKKLTIEDLKDKNIQKTVQNINKKNIQMGVSTLTYKEFENIKYTYGIELETIIGRFEDSEVEHLNVKAVHDGSLRDEDGNSPLGGEYVTGVLVGDAGLAQLYELCRVLNTKCKVDKRCGNHVHIGNLNWNTEDVVYSYVLAELLENEIFSTLPKSRRNNSYCRPIDKLLINDFKELVSIKSKAEYDIKLDEMYEKIYQVAVGRNYSKNLHKKFNKNTNHPQGPKCGYDKSSQRYCWLNYVTLLFNTKEVNNSHTLEFRPMSGTLNYIKIKNWLKLCMAFCYFVENNKSDIKNAFNKPVDLNMIIKAAYPKTGSRLMHYISERKQLFKTADESVDYPTVKEMSKKSIKEVLCV